MVLIVWSIVSGPLFLKINFFFGGGDIKKKNSDKTKHFDGLSVHTGVKKLAINTINGNDLFFWIIIMIAWIVVLNNCKYFVKFTGLTRVKKLLTNTIQINLQVFCKVYRAYKGQEMTNKYNRDKSTSICFF